MRSRITEDLYRLMLHSGQQVIGLARTPFLRFSDGRHLIHWYLFYADKDVILVSFTRNGHRARFTILQVGEPGCLDSMAMLTEKLLMKFLQ